LNTCRQPWCLCVAAERAIGTDMINVPGIFCLILLVNALLVFITPLRYIDADDNVSVFRALCAGTVFLLSVPTLCRNILDGFANGMSEKNVGRIPAQVCFMMPSAFLCLASVVRLHYDYRVLSPLGRRLVRRCPCLVRPRCLSWLSLWICFSGGLRFVHHWYHSDRSRQFGWDHDRVLVSMSWIACVLFALIFETTNAWLDFNSFILCSLARCFGDKSREQEGSNKKD